MKNPLHFNKPFGAARLNVTEHQAANAGLNLLRKAMEKDQTTPQDIPKQVKIRLKEDAPALFRANRAQMSPAEWKYYHALCALKADPRERSATEYKFENVEGYLISAEDRISMVPILLEKRFVEVLGIENVQN